MATQKSHNFGRDRCHGGREGQGCPRQKRAGGALAAPGGLQVEEDNYRGAGHQLGRSTQHSRKADVANRAQGARRQQGQTGLRRSRLSTPSRDGKGEFFLQISSFFFLFF